jgi:glycosyltransferase involved in cell wall biosynthesis
MTGYPRISIVTPSFNQARFIERTLHSVLSQDYANLEYIVMDGGSRDGSAEIIARHADRLAHWESQPDRGQSHAINKGFARATGEILGWLNSDDWLEPGALARVAQEATCFPDAGAFVGEGRVVDLGGRVCLHKKPGELSFEAFCRWLDGDFFMQPACFFRRSAWEASGPLDEDLHMSLDLDLWLRMVRRVPFRAVDQWLATSLRHPDAKTRAQRSEMFAEALIVIIKAGGEAAVRQRLTMMASAARTIEARSRPSAVGRLMARVTRSRPSVEWG